MTRHLPHLDAAGRAAVDHAQTWLVGLMANLRAHGMIKDLPPAAIVEFAVGVPRRLARQAAAGELTLGEKDLIDVAQACWKAIAN